MFVTQPLNELAKLALIASDASYFTATVSAPQILAPLQDTPSYNILPTYAIAQGFEKQFERRNDAIGFKFVTYKNATTNEVIVAFGGTDGPDPVDWTGNTALGWNQWLSGREQVFADLRLMVDSETKIHFTGQSLGGALAQYAAYEWVQTKETVTNPLDPEFLADFNKSNVSLTTFNGIGGLKGLTDHVVYDPTVLQGLGLSGHFYVTNDLVSRLGGGHVGGDTFLLDFKSGNINPLTGLPYAYGLVDAHRIETGFYANLRPGALLEFQVSPGTSPIAYLNVDSVQEIAALFGNLLNNKDLGLTESRFRLVAAVTAGLTIGSPSSVSTMTQALITSLHNSGDLSDSWFQTLQGVNWGAIFIPTRPVTGAIAILSTLGAVFTDAVHEAGSGISTVFQAIGDYVSAGSRPDVTVTPPAAIDTSSRQLQFEVLMASLGAAPHLAELTASLPSELDPEALAAQMLSGGADWLPATVVFARTHANTAGQTPAQLAEMTTQLFIALNHRIDALQDVTLEEKGQLVAQLNTFTQDTAQGFAKAYSEFLQGVAGSFDLGRVLSFLDINLIDQAYAAELSDPRLSSSVRVAVEDAQAIVQRAGQAVVLEKGIGPNPFNGAGFNPNDPGTISNATLPEGQLQAYTLALPFEAGVGGQRVQLQLSGTGVSALRVRAGGLELTPQNGVVTLLVPEGQRQLVFGLQITDDVDVEGGLTLNATLVGANNVATHTTHEEATLTLDAEVEGTIDYNNGLPSQTFTGDDTDNAFGPLGGGGGALNVTAFGHGGDDFIFAHSASQAHHQFFGGNDADFLQGALGHDRLYGEAGRDILIGFEGDDVLEGGDQEDALSGGLGDDVLDGGADDDSLTGNGGVDVLRGGLGADLLAGDAVITALADMGSDSLDGEEGNDWLFGFLGDDELVGGADDDHLYGDTLPANAPSFNYEWPGSITPVAANPFTSLTGGDDYLDGGAGDDYLQGDAGDDMLFGGTGHDQLWGDDLQVAVIDEGADWLEGEGGNDQLVGGGGEDALFGGEGDDVLVGDYANNAVLGFDDMLDGGAGVDELQGGGGADLLLGGTGADRLFGEAGDDVLDGGQGADELQGGDGADLLDGGTENDRLFGQEGNDDLAGGTGDDLLVGDIGDDFLEGEAGVDQLQGGDGADTLLGGDGDDQLLGGAGDDLLVGGAGVDTLEGGTGADTYVFNLGDGIETIQDTAGEGNRLVFGAGITEEDLTLGLGSLLIRVGSTGDAIHIQGFNPADPSIPTGIEQFEFTDGTTLTHAQLVARGFDLVGTNGDDELIGGETYRKIFGLDGNDRLTGGAVDNVLDGGSGTDVMFGHGGIDQLFGGTGDDVMLGGDGNDVLNGEAGNDSLEGEAGDDRIDAGAGDDTVNAGEGNDLALGGAGNDVLRGDSGNDTLLGGEGNDTIFSGTGDDTVDGGAGDDTIYGQGGTDVVDGGTGNDRLIGASGSYTYSFGTGSGHDIIESTQGGTYTIQMSAGVSPSDVTVGRVGQTITLNLHGSLDTLTLPTFYVNHAFQVQFANGTVWDATTIHNQAGGGLQVGTSGSDFIFGYNGFPDEMIGLAGDDVYIVNDLGDVVEEASNEGYDAVLSTVDFTLPDHVERLTLDEPYALYDLVGPVVLHVDPAAVSATGNALDNILHGNSFNNILVGGAGDDTLDGGLLIYGNLISTSNDDTLIGGPGNDTYYYDAFYGGVDTIIDQSSAGESNTLIIGNLSVYGSNPSAGFHLRLDGTVLVMEIDVEASSIVENTRELRFPDFDPNDAYGLHAIDVFNFQDGNPLSYQQFIDLGISVEGTNSDDILTGTSAVDRFTGGKGNDSLSGGAGNDLYRFNLGDGIDTIHDSPLSGQDNRIVFGPGIAASDLFITWDATALTIAVGEQGDAINLADFDRANTAQSIAVQTLQFADGSVIDLASSINNTGTDGDDTLIGGSGNELIDGRAGHDVLTGGSGDDFIIGRAGDDTLDGGSGNDRLFGGSSRGSLDYDNGNDIYLFGRGSGQDVVMDRDVKPGNLDTIRLAADLAPTDVAVQRDHADLLLTINGSTDSLRVSKWFQDGPINQVERIEFGNGTVWDVAAIKLAVLTGSQGSDTILGYVTNDVLNGGAGNDTLVGGPGDDIYQFGLGSGRDTIQDRAGENNVIVLASGVLLGEVTLLRGGDDLHLVIDGTTDRLTVANWFQPSGPTVDHIQFSDGTSWTAAMIPPLSTIPPSNLFGTVGDDTLVGGPGNDYYLDGGAGNDSLYGGQGTDVLISGLGDDILDGGAGNDSLFGGAGNDTYRITRGGGFDFMFDENGLNTVEFGEGIAPEDITVQMTPIFSGTAVANIIVSVGDGDGVGLSMMGLSSVFHFSTGEELSMSDVLAKFDGGTVNTNGTTGDDQLVLSDAQDGITGDLGNDQIDARGGDDVVDGGGGSDIISLGSGNDTLESLDDNSVGNTIIAGGPGDDIISKRNGADVFAFNAGDGRDLLDAFDFTPTAEEVDTLSFGLGITPQDVRAYAGNLSTSGSIGQGSVFLSIGNGQDSIEIPGLLTSVSGTWSLRTGPVIERVQFLDGTNARIFDFAGILSLLVDDIVSATATSPVALFTPATAGFELTGTVAPAGGLNAQAYARNGDLFGIGEVYTRGGADDVIRAYTGNDTINAGDGNNVIYDLGGNTVVTSGTGQDTVTTGDGNDFISSGAGTDVIHAGAGDDRLSGGTGQDDQLGGGAGDDTYVFNLGDGVDRINDVALAGEGNRIEFGAGITRSMLQTSLDQGDLILSVGANGDALRLTNFDPTGVNGSLMVETLVFADGSTANLADLLSSSVNHAPTVASPLADQTVPEDAPFNVVLPSNTFADEDAGDVLTLSASLADGTALPAWLNFNAATATFSGAPDDAQVGNLDLRVTATDQATLSASDVFTLTVTNVNETPTVSTPLADQQATEDAAFNFVVPAGTFADVDSGDVLAYSATLEDGTSLPAWLSFNSTTRTFSGTPGNADVGTLALRVTATDQSNLSASTNFTLAIQNVNDAPTVVTPIADQTAAEDSAFVLTVPSTTFADEDVIHGDELTYSATLVNGNPLPAWLSFNPTTRTLSGTPGAGDAGSLQIAVTGTDSGNLSATDQFTLVISDPLPQTVIGTAGNDVLTGGRGNDTLSGLAGNDALNGGQGHDLLDGGTGTDTMQGGAGHDLYIVDVSGDVVTELANEGTDIVQSAITYTLGANVEQLTLTGTANLNGTGNALDNILTGNGGTNVLTGGAGNDTYLVGAGDSVSESLNGGTDTVQSSITWTLGSNVENLTLTGTANINGTGSSANNILVGNSGNNTLDSGSGNDTVDGGDGNDSLLGGSGDDQLLGGGGDDTLTAGSGNDVLSGGGGGDTLDGGSSDDQLLGGAGNDALSGGSGADQFTGGTGNDALTGGSGNDLYNFSRGDGQDTISDLDPFTGNQDRALFGATINPLDLVISRQANDLRLTIHGSSDQITVQNWYLGTTNHIETIQAGNGQTLLSTQVDQLIQAMAGFTAQTGLTWDQAIDQQPQDVQAILAASWQ